VLALASLFTCGVAPVAGGANADEGECPRRGLGADVSILSLKQSARGWGFTDHDDDGECRDMGVLVHVSCFGYHLLPFSDSGPARL